MGGQPISALDAHLLLFTEVFSPAESLWLFNDLCEQISWKQELITIGGRQVLTPRLTSWYGDPGAAYRYSGVTLSPLPWIPALAEIKVRVEALAGTEFNSVLANLYRDGRDSVGWHSDDEHSLGERPVIASVSLGAVRRFLMRHKKRKDVPQLEINLPDGSVFLMQGDTQRFWKHQLPKTAKPVGPRINLTFRRIVNPER